jgi:hypothetical protein
MKWITGLVSPRSKALTLYRAGMAKANKRDYQGAIADYTAALKEPKIPNDVKGMAIYNRALAYSAIHQEDNAAADLAAMLQMPGLPENIRTQAHQRRERIRRRTPGADVT